MKTEIQISMKRKMWIDIKASPVGVKDEKYLDGLIDALDWVMS